MKYYKYSVRLEIEVMAEDEYQAEDTLEMILPKGDGIYIDMIDLREEEDISFEEAVADCERCRL